jgi:Spy/CpxP family protein refolding chaperone
MTKSTSHRFATLAAAALVAVVAAPAAHAQWGVPAQVQQRDGRGGSLNGDPGPRMEQRLGMMQRQLGLSSYQIDQIRQANADHERDWQRYQQASRQQGGLTAQQQAQWQNLENGYQQRVESVLTAQQRQVYSGMRSGQRGAWSVPRNGNIDRRRVDGDRSPQYDHDRGYDRGRGYDHDHDRHRDHDHDADRDKDKNKDKDHDHDHDHDRDRRSPPGNDRDWSRGRP